MSHERLIVSQLISNLDCDEILLVTGPRQVGKTTALHQVESYVKSKHSVFFLNLEDPDYLSLLNQSPKKIFDIFPIDTSKKTYLFIDEIQYLKNPSNFLKYLYDEYHGKLKIIASGSSAFYLDKKFTDSMSGRKKIFVLYSLSFREFLLFKNQGELVKKNFSKLTLSEINIVQRFYNEYLIWGGYPKVILSENSQQKIEILRDLVYSYIKKDIYEANIKSDEQFIKLLKILSSQIGNLVNANELSRTLGLSKTAVDNYLTVLQKSFHIKLVRPFYKNIRKEIVRMPKVFFNDLGLRNFLKNDFRTILERDDAGQLIENGFYRQLLDRFDSEQLKYWRTITGKEVDFIVDNERLAFEVKKDVKQIKTSKYSLFKDEYADFDFKFVTLNKSSIDKKTNAISVWEI